MKFYKKLGSNQLTLVALSFFNFLSHLFVKFLCPCDDKFLVSFYNADLYQWSN